MVALVGMGGAVIGFERSRKRKRGPRSKRRRPTSNTFLVECRLCSFEPKNQSSLPAERCPKCHGHAWLRVLRPGTAEHYAERLRTQPDEA